MKGLEVGEKAVTKFARQLMRRHTVAAPDTVDAPLRTSDTDKSLLAIDRPSLQDPMRPLTPAALFTSVPPARSASSSGHPIGNVSVSTTPLAHQLLSPPSLDASLVSDSIPTSGTPVIIPPRLIPSHLADTPSPFPLSPGVPSSSLRESQADYFSLPRNPASSQSSLKSSVTSFLDSSDRSSTDRQSDLSSLSSLLPPSTSSSDPDPKTSSTPCISHDQPLLPGVRSAYAVILYFLAGDPDKDEAGGVLGFLTFSIGFVFFIIYHVAALVRSTLQFVYSLALFIWWVYINLSGRTDLGQLASRYFSLCRKEWDSVAREDGERLGPWATIVGLAEIAALHAMTRERYLREGPGNLVRIDLSDVKADSPFPSAVEQAKDPKPTPRATPRRRQSKRVEPERIIITSETGSIAEGTLISPHAASEERFESPARLDAFASANASLLPFPSPLSLDAEFSNTRYEEGSGWNGLFEEQEPAWVRAIRRHCRFATASYGLHSYILGPPTPLFTPSGQTLPRSIFRHLARLEDKSSVLHVAIQEEYEGAWGSSASSSYMPTFYLIRDHVSCCPVLCLVSTTTNNPVVSLGQPRDCRRPARYSISARHCRRSPD
jgi:hypothetical protein